MLYHLHFAEDGVPYGDDPFTHDIYFESKQKVNIPAIFSKIDEIKSRMDDPEDILCDDYWNLGWHEKIDEAFNLTLAEYPDFQINKLELDYHEYNIN